MVFDCGEGKTVNGSIIGLGSRSRFLDNEVEFVAPKSKLALRKSMTEPFVQMSPPLAKAAEVRMGSLSAK